MYILSVYIYIAKSCWLFSVHVSDGFPNKGLNGGGWVE